MSAAVCVGIDVSKAHLDVALSEEGTAWRVPNTEPGIQRLVTQSQAHAPTLVVLEATGGYEMPAAAGLAAHGLPVVIVNPRQVRDFAKATGQLAKTDQLDAHVLALFAVRVQPPVRPLPDEAARALEATVARRRQIIEMLTAEKNRLGVAAVPVRKGIEKHIRWLERQLAEVDDDLDGRIRSSAVWQMTSELLQGVPGVGPNLARTLDRRTPGTGTHQSQGNCGPGGRGAFRPRQWDAPGQTHDLGRAGPGALGALHERLERGAVESCDPRVL
jgi:transposase